MATAKPQAWMVNHSRRHHPGILKPKHSMPAPVEDPSLNVDPVARHLGVELRRQSDGRYGLCPWLFARSFYTHSTQARKIAASDADVGIGDEGSSSLASMMLTFQTLKPDSKAEVDSGSRTILCTQVAKNTQNGLRLPTVELVSGSERVQALLKRDCDAAFVFTEQQGF